MLNKTFARTMMLAATMALAAACDTKTRAPETAQSLTAAPSTAPATSAATGTTGTTAADPSAAAPAASAASASTPAAAPVFREVTVPAGTVLTVRLNTAVASDTSQVEQRVDGTLTRSVRIGGLEALGSGAALRGVVTNAERSARVKGRATVAFRFNQLIDEGQTYAINTRTVSRVAPGTKTRDAATIAVPAAGGAVIGRILGGKKGAVKGTVIGGAAGAGAVLSTRGKEVRLAPGSTVSVRLAAPLTVRVSVR